MGILSSDFLRVLELSHDDAVGVLIFCSKLLFALNTLIAVGLMSDFKALDLLEFERITLLWRNYILGNGARVP